MPSLSILKKHLSFQSNWQEFLYVTSCCVQCGMADRTSRPRCGHQLSIALDLLCKQTGHRRWWRKLADLIDGPAPSPALLVLSSPSLRHKFVFFCCGISVGTSSIHHFVTISLRTSPAWRLDGQRPSSANGRAREIRSGPFDSTFTFCICHCLLVLISKVREQKRASCPQVPFSFAPHSDNVKLE